MPEHDDHALIRNMATDTMERLSHALGDSPVSFYSRFQGYDAEMKRAGEDSLAALLRNAWQESGLEDSGLHIPIAVVYVHSEVLRARLAAPCRPHRDSDYDSFYTQYASTISTSHAAKAVLDPARRDHLVGELIFDRTHRQEAIITIRKPDVESLAFMGALDITYPCLGNGTPTPRAMEAAVNWARAFWKDTAAPSNAFNDDAAASLGRFLAAPFQFVSGEMVRNSSGRILPPFYPGVCFAFPNDWKAVHYIYLPEELLCPHSAACTLMVVQRRSVIDNAESVSRAVSERLIPLIRQGLTSVLAGPISRVEQVFLAKINSPNGAGHSVIYPDDYAAQTGAPEPSMPICELLSLLEHEDHSPWISADVGEHVLKPLELLRRCDRSLSTGYRTIALPLLNAARHLWFSLKRDAGSPPDESALQADLEAFERGLEHFRQAAPGEEPDANGDGLLQILQMTLGFESEMAEIPTYREHFIHSYHAFVTGLCILHSLEKCGALSVPGEAVRRKMLRQWMIASLWHDIAYSVQVIDKLANRYISCVRRQKLGPADKWHAVPMAPRYGHFLIPTDMFCAFDTSSNLHGALIPLLSTDPDYPNKVIDKVRQECRGQLIAGAQHGVLAAAILLRHGRSLASQMLDAQAAGEVATAVMLHHCHEWMKSPDDREETAPFLSDVYDIFEPWMRSPWSGSAWLASLLMLCDCLSQWGRNFEQGGSLEVLLMAAERHPYTDTTGRTKTALHLKMVYPTAASRDQIKYKLWYGKPLRFVKGLSAECGAGDRNYELLTENRQMHDPTRRVADICRDKNPAVLVQVGRLASPISRRDKAQRGLTLGARVRPGEFLCDFIGWV